MASNESASTGHQDRRHNSPLDSRALGVGTKRNSQISDNETGRLHIYLRYSDSGGLSASYQHNALGQRTEKMVGSATTVYVYDLDGTLTSEYDATGTLIRDFVTLNGTYVADRPRRSISLPKLPQEPIDFVGEVLREKWKAVGAV